ncbi:hypothetical protein D3C71_1114430 [compost metagenome]
MIGLRVSLVVAAHQGANPCEQHARLNRFDDVIVRAGFQPQNLVQVIFAGGQHQDGRR